MNYAEEIRRQAEAALRAALPEVARALWAAFGDGRVTEAEAETLSRVIEERRQAGQAPRCPEMPAGPASLAAAGIVRRYGSRPRTGVSMERRRRWAASGRMPPNIACQFTLAEQAVLSLVAAETVKRGDCRLAVPHLAAVAGVAETTVRNALREARRIGLITVEERRLTGFRNDTNVVTIVSAEWIGWMRLARRETRRRANRGGGCKSANRTNTGVLAQAESGRSRTSRRRSAGPNPPSQAASRAASA
ncbi:helix-turn-helix domain-containing protein (plasmid) [Methylobacterium oryzae CBMB20]